MSVFPTASLYCGDLHPEVTEAQLYEVFNAVCPVASIRVCRDSVTRRSLGYAYINFHGAQDAERALDLLNYKNIKDRPIRLMWCQRDPSLRKSNKGNIFVKNLEESIDHKALHDTFSAFGNILSCKVVMDETDPLHPKSKGYGFIHYETKEAAETAIAKVNGMLLKGKEVFVGHFVSRKDRMMSVNPEDVFTNVFVKNIPDSWTEDKLKAAFSEFGTVKSCVLMCDNTHKSKCFGFCDFDSHEEAVRAVELLNGKEIDGKSIFASRAKKRAEREREKRDFINSTKRDRQDRNIYVKNLDDNFSDENLREAFKEFGNITSARVMSFADGNSRGFGFVCFSTAEEARSSITKMNNFKLPNNSKPLYVALAQSKMERQAFLQHQHMNLAPQVHMMGRPLGRGQPPMGYPVPPYFYPQFFPRQPGMVPSQPVQPNAQMMRPTGYPPMGAFPQQSFPNAGRGGAGRGKGPGGPGAQRTGPFPGGHRGGPGPRRGMPEMAEMGAHPGMMPMMAPPAAGPRGFDKMGLASMPEEERKKVLGEMLYPEVSKIDPHNGPKITGMLLEMDVSEVIQLLEDHRLLAEKITEANEVLKQHGFV